MRKIINTIILIFFFILMIPLEVHAGTINKFEQDFLNILSYTYEYKGYYYKVPDEYYTQVEDYLSRDDIDWTTEQLNKYKDMFLNNFDYGISQGVFVKVGKVKKVKKKDSYVQPKQEENSSFEDDSEYEYNADVLDDTPEDFEDEQISEIELLDVETIDYEKVRIVDDYGHVIENKDTLKDNDDSDVIDEAESINIVDETEDSTNNSVESFDNSIDSSNVDSNIHSEESDDDYISVKRELSTNSNDRIYLFLGITLFLVFVITITVIYYKYRNSITRRKK